MRFTRLLACRYTFELRKKVAVTLISRFAAFVVGVAVFAFFIVLAVFGGWPLQTTHTEGLAPGCRLTGHPGAPT